MRSPAPCRISRCPGQPCRGSRSSRRSSPTSSRRSSCSFPPFSSGSASMHPSCAFEARGWPSAGRRRECTRSPRRVRPTRRRRGPGARVGHLRRPAHRAAGAGPGLHGPGGSKASRGDRSPHGPVRGHGIGTSDAVAGGRRHALPPRRRRAQDAERAGRTGRRGRAGLGAPDTRTTSAFNGVGPPRGYSRAGRDGAARHSRSGRSARWSSPVRAWTRCTPRASSRRCSAALLSS